MQYNFLFISIIYPFFFIVDFYYWFYLLLLFNLLTLKICFANDFIIKKHSLSTTYFKLSIDIRVTLQDYLNVYARRVVKSKLSFIIFNSVYISLFAWTLFLKMIISFCIFLFFLQGRKRNETQIHKLFGNRKWIKSGVCSIALHSAWLLLRLERTELECKDLPPPFK